MSDKLKVLDLFSGIGGFSYGLEMTGGFETVAFCEVEKFPRAVLRKHWPEVPIYDDVRKLTKASGPDAVDIICGGYPCQPFSVAGKRQGQNDDRHLWPEFDRLVDEYRPRWVVGENVAGHINMGLDDVLSDLEGKGYTCRAFVIPACAVNAPHRRDRVWVVAHASDMQRDGGKNNSEACAGQVSEFGGRYLAADVPNAERVGQSRQGWTQGRMCPAQKEDREASRAIADGGWEFEPGVGRVAHGVPDSVDRLKSLGNAVVPQIVAKIGHAILEAEDAR